MINKKLPKVGLSACLAGMSVRYDGKHKRSSLCLEKLNEYFTFETFCPEVAGGFGTPRPTMRLSGDVSNPKLIYTDSDRDMKIDLRKRLREGFEEKLEEFEDLDGFILMKNSPSCGVSGVKVYHENGKTYETTGQGLFVSALVQRYPLLPIEEEASLYNTTRYEDFLRKVQAHYKSRS
jgi:uncharacterized protein YbbK (DUF523 family)